MRGLISNDQVFIQRLTEIIQSNLANESFGVDELAHLSGLSRTFIHRRLKSVANKSTTQFIRGVRLEQAMKMLQHEAKTASEVAYGVGFSSPAYFNTCFHEYFGFPPGEVLRNGMQESIQDGGSNMTDPEMKDPELPENETPAKNTIQAGWNITGRHLIIYGFFALLMVFGISYLLNVTLFKNKILVSQDKSIAVLPFKNISMDTGNQYFAEAVTKNILRTLVQIKGLKVVASYPLKEYTEDPLNIPLIAKRLHVSFLLYGSVQKEGNKVRIMVMLIDAKQNRYIKGWDYDKEFSDLFQIQGTIAKNVAEELQTVLTPQDSTRIAKIPTRNMEAYSHYLKGRYYLNKGSWKDIDKSREYFEKAIAADPTFAEAHAGLADYMLNCMKRNLCPKKGALEEAERQVRLALELDNNLAEAYAIWGEILCIKWKWDEAEEKFGNAIRLNYNCPAAHQYYAGLLRILRHNDEARSEINLATQLNPTNPLIYLQSARLYWNEGKSREALDECKKVIELDSAFYSVYWTYFNIYLRLGEHLKAYESLQKALSIFPEDHQYKNMVKEYYEKQGIKGLPKAVIQMNENDVDSVSGFIGLAKHYCFLGDKNKALDNLEMALKSEIPGIPYINNDRDFSTLQNEPRFQALLQKMGLSRYQDIEPADSLQ
jgi:TolB-like protein/AraC-like DNA-binding protein/Tfp pilus assembly protein PilF